MKLLTFIGILVCLLMATPGMAVTEFILSGSTATPITFLLVDSATGQIGQTGQTSNITITLQKPGTTSYIASSGTITEIGYGVYNYNPTTAETGGGTTFGPMSIHVTDTTDSAQVIDLSAQVIAANLNDATMLGLTNVATLAAQSSQTTTLGTINTNAAGTNTQTSASNQQTNSAIGILGATTSSYNAAGSIGSVMNGMVTTNAAVVTINTNVAALPSAATVASSVITAMKSDSQLRIALLNHNLNKITYNPTSGVLTVLGDDNTTIGTVTVTTVNNVITSRQ